MVEYNNHLSKRSFYLLTNSQHIIQRLAHTLTSLTYYPSHSWRKIWRRRSTSSWDVCCLEWTRCLPVAETQHRTRIKKLQ